MDETKKRKRKRNKVRCLVCKEEFDDDYRQKHNKKKHGNLLARNKHVGYESVNAVENPFKFCAQKKKEVNIKFMCCSLVTNCWGLPNRRRGFYFKI